MKSLITNSAVQLWKREKLANLPNQHNLLGGKKGPAMEKGGGEYLLQGGGWFLSLHYVITSGMTLKCPQRTFLEHRASAMLARLGCAGSDVIVWQQRLPPHILRACFHPPTRWALAGISNNYQEFTHHCRYPINLLNNPGPSHEQNSYLMNSSLYFSAVFNF